MWLAKMLRYMVSAVVATREDLSCQRADNRTFAYVYRVILVLAATAGAYDSAIRSGEALLVVLGTVVSTYHRARRGRRRRSGVSSCSR